jgi:hypothetical protein
MIDKPKCMRCHDVGLIIIKQFDGEPIDSRFDKYHIMSCNECGRGTDARCHIMMHSQDKESCGCEYSNVLDYWSKRSD